MSSDSSDEENWQMLKDAQDDQFINDSMFNKKGDFPAIIVKNESLPSLRRKSKDEDEQFNLFKVTQEFREYVAKKLDNILDKQLKYKKCAVTDRKISSAKTSGVKLFSDYKVFLSECFEEKARVQSYKKPKLEVSEDLLKQVVVSGEEILSKKEIKFWSNRSKAAVFEYKKNEQKQLVLVEKPFL